MKKVHLFYPGIGTESAERLAKQLKKDGAEVTLHEQSKGAFPQEHDAIHVNWGGVGAGKLFSGINYTWLNHVVIGNKLRMLDKFTTAGVPTVPYVTMFNPGDGWYARKMKHSDGSDLVAKLQNGDFYVKHVDVLKEFRVHVFKGTILRASLKVPVAAGADPVFKIGDKWGFSSENYVAALGHCGPAAIAAVKALGYDFGGVDVAMMENGQPVIFEVNSAPWLGGDSARKYSQMILA